MAERRQRYRTGDPGLDRRIQEVLDEVGVTEDRDQLFEIFVSAVRLASDGADRLNLKITNGALKELRAAFVAFAPYRHVPKVTMFGSARTRPEDPLYAQARDMARLLAEQGWMVVTGAGPGIMAAGMEGAGREKAFGVTIRLPFEQSANAFIAGDEKLVAMKYFFTRKLMLLKESSAFVSLPGGFGTLDEVFELLTLVQTGKATPAPIVLLDTPGGTYWQGWRRFVVEEVGGPGLISPEDLDLFLVTDDVAEAAAEVLRFHAVYHSLRWVGDRLVVRLRHPVGDDALAALNERFADRLHAGPIERTPPLPEEVADGDRLELPRLLLHLDRSRHWNLRSLIDALNEWAPDEDIEPFDQTEAETYS